MICQFNGEPPLYLGSLPACRFKNNFGICIIFFENICEKPADMKILFLKFTKNL